MKKSQKLKIAKNAIDEERYYEYFELMDKEVLEDAQKTALNHLRNAFILSEKNQYFAEQLRLLALDVFDERANADRKELLEGLEKRYKNRLRQKLEEYNFQNIEAVLEYTTHGTSQRTVEEIFLVQEGSVEGLEKLIDRFTNEFKSMLILGEAGAGKTVLLLRMGLGLIGYAKNDALFPVPVLLNLVTWRNEDQELIGWIEKNLPFSAGESGISKKYAHELCLENNLLLLLDGLDEVPENERVGCLKAIKRYDQDIDKQHKYPNLLICSRKDEYDYEKTKQDAEVAASVIFKELDQAYLLGELGKLKETKNARALFKRLEANPALCAEIRTTFDLHLALKLIREDDFELGTQPLVPTFLQKSLEKTVKPTQTRQVLHFLASQLHRRKQGIRFELIDLQPDWLSKPWKYQITLALIGGFFFFGFDFIYLENLNLAVVMGLIIGIAGYSSYKIEPEEIRVWNWKTFDWITIAFWIGGAEVIGLIIGFFTKDWMWLVYNLNIGLYLGIIETGFQIRRSVQVRSPYQRFFAPFAFSVFQWTPAVLIGRFFVSFVQYQMIVFEQDLFWWFMNVVNWIGLALLAIGLLSSLFQHFILRVWLWLEGHLPLNLVRVLDQAAAVGLLEKGGGAWRFRHQRLFEEVLNQNLQN